MCARHGRAATEICLSEKGALAKKRLVTLVQRHVSQPSLHRSEVVKSCILNRNM